MTVTKECVLAPCFLDSSGNSALRMKKDCDTGADSFNCVYCCKGDGCNAADTTTTATKAVNVIAAALVAAIYGLDDRWRRNVGLSTLSGAS